MIDINGIGNNDQQVQLTQDQVSEVEGWLAGKSDVTPDFIKTLTTGLQNKIEYSMCYILTQHMRRAISLLNFLEEAESTLYDKNSLLTKNTEEIQDLYKEASKTASSSLEWVRKYMVQNKEMLAPKDEKTETLLDLVSTLSSDEMNKLIETIQNMKSGN